MKGQVALELLIVVGFLFLLSVPFLGAFLRFLNDNIELRIAAVDAQSIASVNNTTIFLSNKYFPKASFIHNGSMIAVKLSSGVKGAFYSSINQMYGILPQKPGIYRILKWQLPNGTIYVNFSS